MAILENYFYSPAAIPTSSIFLYLRDGAGTQNHRLHALHGRRQQTRRGHVGDGEVAVEDLHLGLLPELLCALLQKVERSNEEGESSRGGNKEQSKHDANRNIKIKDCRCTNTFVQYK